MQKYIDISAHQGIVNFEALKGTVDGIILRAGYGTGTVDKYFIRNARECNRLGIPCGAYWFSYAYTVGMAQKEANMFLNTVAPFKMELPLAYDFEYDSVSYAQKQGATITAALVKQMTNTFCQTIEQNGYWCMLYTNGDYINRYFGDLAGGRYDLWYASWPANPDLNHPPRQCGIWQYSNKGQVAGISGNVDMDVAYKDYPTLLRQNGCNHLTVVSTPVEEEKPVENTQTSETTTNQSTISTTDSTSESKPLTNREKALKWAMNKKIYGGANPDALATQGDVVEILYNYHTNLH